MSKRCRLIDFNELYDERYKITNYKDIDRDKKFTDDGIFSETVFGSLTDDNIETIGWIDLGQHYIINPIMYNHIKRLFGNKFDKMIKYAKVLNKEGEVSLEEEQQQENWEEDDNLGLKEFKERFLELIEKWGNTKKYEKEYNFIIDNLKYVFINKYPVFNAKLRPKHVGPVIEIL